MIGVDLERRQQRRNVRLSHRPQHLLHLHRRLVLIGDDARRAVGKPHRGAYILHAIAQRRLQLVEQRLQLLGLIGLRLVLQVLTRRSLIHGLQIDLSVLVDAREDDFVDVIIEE